VKPPAAKDLRHEFIAWQCRIRQIAVRQDGGRPSPGMRPRVLDPWGREIAPALTVLMIPRHPEESTAFFRFQVEKTNDPRDIYERALGFLQADYFQQPEKFSGLLAAVLPPGSPLAAALSSQAKCILEFDQFSQRYRFSCAVLDLPKGDSVREAAIWHNRAFNPSLPDDAIVLGLKPEWKPARA
jgi:hypothetical protein